VLGGFVVADAPAVPLVLIDALVNTNFVSFALDAVPVVPLVPAGFCWARLTTLREKWSSPSAT
jgi:hypothetical protein